MKDLTTKRKAILTMRAFEIASQLDQEDRIQIIVRSLIQEMMEQLNGSDIDKMGNDLPEEILNATIAKIEENETPELLN